VGFGYFACYSLFFILYSHTEATQYDTIEHKNILFGNKSFQVKSPYKLKNASRA
jgi:hypothetical protein